MTVHCSFCGKSHHEVARLIAGPKVYICNECVAVCVEIFDEIKMEEKLFANVRDYGT